MRRLAYCLSVPAPAVGGIGVPVHSLRNRVAALVLAAAALLALTMLLSGSGSARAQAAPEVTGVAVSSTPPSGDTYAFGEIITITVTFSEAVDVTGTPQITIDMDPADWGAKVVDYASGSGTATLTFDHKVVQPNYSQPGDRRPAEQPGAQRRRDPFRLLADRRRPVPHRSGAQRRPQGELATGAFGANHHHAHGGAHHHPNSHARGGANRDLRRRLLRARRRRQLRPRRDDPGHAQLQRGGRCDRLPTTCDRHGPGRLGPASGPPTRAAAARATSASPTPWSNRTSPARASPCWPTPWN